MNAVSLEISKRLWEVSGWLGVAYEVNVTLDPGRQAIESGHVKYDCGYLLRKLPRRIELTEFHEKRAWLAIQIPEDIRGTRFMLNPQGIADTPEDALALLAIELHEKGILKKEGE